MNDQLITALPWRITEPNERKGREIAGANGATVAKLTALDMGNAELIVASVNRAANANPPAQQSDAWHDAVLNCCMGVESCYVANDPAKTLNNLINWYVLNERSMAAQPAEPVAQHYDDYAVDSFTQMMKEKLAKSRAKGRSGWNDPKQCSVEYLNKLLLEHVEKGDPVDVANFCMMLRHYDARITSPSERQISFDEWKEHPYTKVLEKSIGEDYVPKDAAAQLAQAQYKIVPIEPTTAILEAMQRATDFCPSNMSNVYRAMIAAAPDSAARAAEGNVETAADIDDSPYCPHCGQMDGGTL